MVSFIYAYQNNIYAFVLTHLSNGTATFSNVNDYFSYAYFKTYTRMPMYFIGVIFGYHYFMWKNSSEKEEPTLFALVKKLKKN